MKAPFGIKETIFEIVDREIKGALAESRYKQDPATLRNRVNAFFQSGKTITANADKTVQLMYEFQEYVHGTEEEKEQIQAVCIENNNLEKSIDKAREAGDSDLIGELVGKQRENSEKIRDKWEVFEIGMNAMVYKYCTLKAKDEVCEKYGISEEGLVKTLGAYRENVRMVCRELVDKIIERDARIKASGKSVATCPIPDFPLRAEDPKVQELERYVNSRKGEIYHTFTSKVSTAFAGLDSARVERFGMAKGKEGQLTVRDKIGDTRNTLLSLTWDSISRLKPDELYDNYSTGKYLNENIVCFAARE